MIAVPVALMLTLVGLSHGFVEDSARRTRGVGADIIVRSPDASLGGLTMNSIPQQLADRLEKVDHVTLATGVAGHLVSGWTTVSGIELDKFERMRGGFVFRKGHSFQNPNDVLLDTYYAQQVHVRAGGSVKLFNHDWHVAGIVETRQAGSYFSASEDRPGIRRIFGESRADLHRRGRSGTHA